MQKLFENWRRYQKEVVYEAKQPEYLGAWRGKGGGDLRHMYIVDGQAYYTSTGTGGHTKKGDLVQFGGIIEADVVPGPDGDEIATRKARDEYIKRTKAGGRSYGNVYKGEWVVKNPAGKDIGDRPGALRDLKAERRPRILSTEDINKTLKKRGILRPNWAVRHGLEHIDFPGVTKVRRLRRGEKPPKGGGVDPLYDRSVVKRNDPKIQKQINKELRELGKLPPEKTFKQFIIKYSTKIPLLGRFFKVIFASTIATMVVLEAEEAYAKGGPEAAALVYVDTIADWVSILGDIKGGVEIAMALAEFFGVEDPLPNRSRPDASGEPGDIEDYPMEYPDVVGVRTPEEEEIGPVPDPLDEAHVLFENWQRFIGEQDGPRLQRGAGPTVLIFGHSQTSKNRVGGAQQDKLISLGIPKENIKLVVKSGRNDEGLLSEISNIQGTFTHVILHLDGNSSIVSGCKLKNINDCSTDGPARFQGQKSAIINYVKDNLSVPEKNILIFTPPVNREYGKGGRLFGRAGRKMGKKSYKRRGIGHLRAINYFRSSFPEASVPDLIVADDNAFSDGLHMRKSAAAEAANIAAQAIGNI